MLVATAVALGGLPIILPATALADLLRLRFRLPTTRIYLFFLQYLVNDTVEIVAAPVLWLRAGLGTRLGSAASVERHERLQWWSLRLLQRRADRLLGLRLQIEGDDLDGLLPGPVIALARHVSLFDASLPGLLFQSQGIHVRGAIMAEMLADPGFDLIYARSGSVFLPRDRGDVALAEVRRMTAGIDANTALVIFPEGRLFRPEVAPAGAGAPGRDRPGSGRAPGRAQCGAPAPPRRAAGHAGRGADRRRGGHPPLRAGAAGLAG